MRYEFIYQKHIFIYKLILHTDNLEGLTEKAELIKLLTWYWINCGDFPENIHVQIWYMFT